MKKIFNLLIIICFLGIIFSLSSCKEESNKIKNLKLKAENGDAISQYTLGGIYYFGEETSQDDEEAFYWFEKSALQNLPEAQYFLGLMFKNGEGTSSNLEQSFYWLKKSAEQEDSEAQYELAQLYDLGLGTIKDRRNSIYWYKKSAEQGNKDSQEYLNYMINIIGKEELPNEYKTFKKCEILAKKGNSNAQLYLGLMLFYGKGIEKNKNKAGYWISESMTKGGNIKGEQIWNELELWLYYNGR